MGKAVGLSRAIKLEWANKTVQLVKEGMTSENIKAALDDYLSYEINDPTNISKVRNILLNMWVNEFDNEEKNNARKYALQHYTTNNSVMYHWCMLLIAYPIFVEWTGLLGKISNMQDSFSGAWLKGKTFEKFGERTTLLYATEKLLQTIKQFNVIVSLGKGNYKFNSISITADAQKILIIKTILALKLRAYYEPAELSSITQMFPFEFEINSDLIFGSGNFEIGNFGGNPVIVGCKVKA